MTGGRRVLAGGALVVLAMTSPAAAADAVRGRTLFRQQCGLCHEAAPGDGDGGQGPALAGVVGRKIAGDPGFPYSTALSAMSGAWTQSSLAAFLQDPSKAVPGTVMAVRIEAAADRADIAAYLAGVMGAP